MKELQPKSEKQKEKKVVTVRLSPETAERLEKLAKKEHRSISAQISLFLERGFSNLAHQLNLEKNIK
ncbi:ribbon-helix-helix protein, CopG family [uncultured Akkermansia sp.]|uniref:ribbon-helix-helix protein, CopG family n=1 Tax=uncultured Akkermansia sp. TaxID=512294 RepID=UPI00261201A3|nr:ribbon-helix-helix protein, CopG family [uncultured Akkermansia sp.]